MKVLRTRKNPNPQSQNSAPQNTTIVLEMLEIGEEAPSVSITGVLK